MEQTKPAAPPSSNGSDEDAIIAFLSDGADRIVETHAARIFLREGEALKTKRPVKYDYLDFSTPDRRRSALARELELNARHAPQIYRDLVPVTRDEAGTLALAGKGAPVDWVLRMHRFPAEDELSSIAMRGRLDGALAERLGEVVARYHATCPVREADGATLIVEILDELDAAFGDMADMLDEDMLADLRTRSRLSFGQLAPLLRRRARAGRVRRAHGDLHLRNIVMINGVPVPFDALEFDETLGTCDVLYDLAFLLMDLLVQGLPLAANRTFNAWLGATRSMEDEQGLAALPLFIAIRAAIRAMVDVQTARLGGHQPQDARRHLALALRALETPPACLIAVGGLSGVGKTAVARALAPDLGPLPGAVHLSADLERKAHFGVPPLHRLGDEAYTPEANAAVQARLHARAARCLAAGHAVILDTTHLDIANRAETEALARAAHVPFCGMWLTAPPKTLHARIAARNGDASDADARVLDMQLARDPGPSDWTPIDAARELPRVLDTARRTAAAAICSHMPQP
ncbi:AAA family ATPase [Pontivivens ytuae]|uniref:AAA family ATPase n=1 Tax=Pontivivens ytuae TaxID=2789856 RepID=A0A7S9QCE5_9RHOB|nr:bifunctional aminoglycoside phosphotransferase/ATP-binding protein [Pontivivens ytuae]QPH54123.1 AAA family ATPase [Pontivivens ytuae]